MKARPSTEDRLRRTLQNAERIKQATEQYNKEKLAKSLDVCVYYSFFFFSFFFSRSHLSSLISFLLKHLSKVSNLKEKKLEAKSQKIYEDKLTKAKLHESKLKAQDEAKVARTLAYLTREAEQQRKLQEMQAHPRPPNSRHATNKPNQEGEVEDLK